MKRWTESEKVLLLALIQQGLKPKEIAEKMDGRTTSAVFNRIYNNRDIHIGYQEAKSKRGYVRKPYKVRGPYKKKKTQTAVESREPTVVEIRSIADDNRIWLAMASGVTSAFLSFATLVVILLALIL